MRHPAARTHAAQLQAHGTRPGGGAAGDHGVPPRARTRRARLRVVHVINSFEYGGAEAMLCNLLLRCDMDRFEPSVAALIDDLTVAGPVLRAGIPVATMGMRPGVPDPAGLLRLAGHLRRAKPDVVHAWMDHSNLIAGIAARLAGTVPVVWGVHHAHHVPGVVKRSTRLTVAACTALSGLLPARIVYCSEAGRRLYEGHGCAAAKGVVIPNGFDVDAFKPDAAVRAQVRAELGAGPRTPLVGLVARYDPFKDHATFLKAAALLTRARPEVRFVLCGHRVDESNAGLAAQVAALGLGRRCYLLGPRRDVARIYAALDVLASSSISEAFPLAVGEAMACGVPCVVTDVGDSALLVGPAGKVVPPHDPPALAAAMGEVLMLPPAGRASLGAAARRRVWDQFALDDVARRYEAVYEQAARPQRRPHATGDVSRHTPAPGTRRRGSSGGRNAPLLPEIPRPPMLPRHDGAAFDQACGGDASPVGAAHV